MSITVPRPTLFRSRLLNQLRGWSKILFRSITTPVVRESRGFSTVLVVVMMFAIVTSLAILVDSTGLLMAKQRVAAMAELGTAAGGRVIVEEVLRLAEEGIDGKTIPPEDASHPERYLTTSTIQFLQTDGALRNAVTRTVESYVLDNKPEGWSDFNPERDMTIMYPEKIVDCTEANERFVNVKTKITYPYPFIFGGLLRTLKGTDTLPVSAESYYRIQVCP